MLGFGAALVGTVIQANAGEIRQIAEQGGYSIDAD